MLWLLPRTGRESTPVQVRDTTVPRSRHGLTTRGIHSSLASLTSIAATSVPCRVLKDKVYINGVLEERTSDYYSQDQDGNVWYFGEDTAELDEKGHVVSTEGTWLAGRDGAEAGIFMEAHPQVGHTFQQEYYKGQAEDYYRVLSTRARVRVPYGHFGGNSLRRNVELTKEWTPLEPTIRDHKYYVRGIGQVREITARGRPIESLSLVRIQQR